MEIKISEYEQKIEILEKKVANLENKNRVTRLSTEKFSILDKIIKYYL